MGRYLAARDGHFAIDEVAADKEHLSRGNLETVEKTGGPAFIPLKVDTAEPSGGSICTRTYHCFSLNRQPFLDHCRQRSGVESTMSMIKGKFGDAVRGKSDTAQVNEVLCKVLCRSICGVIQSIHELGIEPVFVKEAC